MPWGLGGSGFLPAATGPTLIEETVINEYGQPQHSFGPGPAPDLDQGAIEQAGYAANADPFGSEDSPTDDGVADDSDLADDLDQA